VRVELGEVIVAAVAAGLTVGGHCGRRRGVVYVISWVERDRQHGRADWPDEGWRSAHLAVLISFRHNTATLVQISHGAQEFRAARKAGVF
jgi:hypothetical protein